MKIKLLTPTAKIPTKGSDEAAGYDLYASEDTIVYPGRNIIPTGIAIALERGTHAHIRPRSGFSSKGFEGHRITDGEIGHLEYAERFDADVEQGTVDSDYRNGVGVIVKSNESQPFMVTQGTRIAQMVILKHEEVSFDVVNELNETARGTGGFGSTGTH